MVHIDKMPIYNTFIVKRLSKYVYSKEHIIYLDFMESFIYLPINNILKHLFLLRFAKIKTLSFCLAHNL